MRFSRKSQLHLLGHLPSPSVLYRPQFYSQFMRSLITKPHTIKPALSLARISLENISSTGWWLPWDTAAGVTQAAKPASGHSHKNIYPIGSLSLTYGLK